MNTLQSLISPGVIQGMLRALMAAVGGIMVTKGHATSDQVSSLTNFIASPDTQGAFVIGCTIAWSYFHKTTPTAPVAVPVVATPAVPVAAK